MNSNDLPRSSPEAQGVDPAGISTFLDRLESASDIEMHSLMILRHGLSSPRAGGRRTRRSGPHLLYSLSKSFTSTAAGVRRRRGAARPRRPPCSPTSPSSTPRSPTRAAGRCWSGTSPRWPAGTPAETVDRAVALDPVEPGPRLPAACRPSASRARVFAYNQPCTYTLAAIIQRLTGQTLTDYLRPRLFDPLGIGEVGWQQYPAGRDIGFTGLHATTEAIARLGPAVPAARVWEGRRLLSEDWVAEATRVAGGRQRRTQPNPDWRQGYGFQFWMSRHGYRGDGAYGQFCLVLPEQDAVIATTAATEDMQGILDAVWAHLLPAMMATTVGPSPVAELVARLAGLQLAAFQAKPAPDTSAAAWAEASFLPAGRRCEAQPTLTGVKLHHDGEHWRLTFVEGHVAFSATVGSGSWQTTLTETDDGGSGPPLAVSGGWTDEDTFGAEITFSRRRTGSNSPARGGPVRSRPGGEPSRCMPGDCASFECPVSRTVPDPAQVQWAQAAQVLGELSSVLAGRVRSLDPRSCRSW